MKIDRGITIVGVREKLMKFDAISTSSSRP